MEIKSSRLTKDYQGKDVVIVTYGFTNNSKENQAFAWAFSDKAFQNGVEPQPSYSYRFDDTEYTSDNANKEIKPGTTLDIEQAYELSDLTSDVKIEVEELFSLDSKIITKTFAINQ